MKLTNLEILQAFLDDNGGEIEGDEEMVERAVDELIDDNEITFEYEEPDPSVGIAGGMFVEGIGELSLEWWDDEWPELQETHGFGHTNNDNVDYAVDVRLETMTITCENIRVVGKGCMHHGQAYRVTARYSWEAKAV